MYGVLWEPYTYFAWMEIKFSVYSYNRLIDILRDFSDLTNLHLVKKFPSLQPGNFCEEKRRPPRGAAGDEISALLFLCLQQFAERRAMYLMQKNCGYVLFKTKNHVDIICLSLLLSGKGENIVVFFFFSFQELMSN